MTKKTQEQITGGKIGNWVWVGDMMVPAWKQKVAKRKNK